MKNTNSSLLACCLSSLLVLSSTLVAQTETSKPNETKIEKPRVEVNSRPLPPELSSKMQKERAAETEDETNATSLHSARPKSKSETLPKTNLDVLCPFSSHWITSFSLTGDVIELEDGSQWAVALNEVFKVLGWRVGDNISITPNYSPFSSYNYYIVNNSANNYVHVSPFIGPVAFGPNTNWIVGIDFFSGQVSMVNGNGDYSVWAVSNSDYYLFSTWALNDTVIVGDNTSWLYAFSSFKNILINVNMNHFVRGFQL